MDPNTEQTLKAVCPDQTGHTAHTGEMTRCLERLQRLEQARKRPKPLNKPKV